MILQRALWSQAVRTAELFWWTSCEICADLLQRQSLSFSLSLILRERTKGHICQVLPSTCPFEFWSFCKQPFEGINTQLQKNKKVFCCMVDKSTWQLFYPPPHHQKSNTVHRDIVVGGSGITKPASQLVCLSYLRVFNLLDSCLSPGCSYFTFTYLRGSLIWFSQQQQQSPKRLKERLAYPKGEIRLRSDF